MVGATAGKIAALRNGATKVELLTLATKKLGLQHPATRVFGATGDEFDEDEDVDLIVMDDALYVSCGEAFQPAGAEPAPPDEPPAAAEEAPAIADPPSTDALTWRAPECADPPSTDGPTWPAGALLGDRPIDLSLLPRN